ncbi:MAG: hypothetical protein GY754_09225, partial [bacterium]|nr:hypothetical protein [bacterium]
MGKTSKKVSFSKTKTSVVTLGGKNIAQVKKLTFYLQFFYYNPYNTSSDKWRPLPDGLDVIMYDYDTLSPNDELGKAKTTGDGTPICLQVDDKDENKPDIFFIIKTNKKFINLDTEKLVDSVENPSTFPYIRLPETIDSRSKKATDKQKGYLRNYSGKGEGKNEKGKEWTFKLEDIQMFIQLQYYRESGDTSEFMPEGLKVSGYDEDSFLSPDDLQATGCIGENGKVYLPIFNKDEQKPELYFTILNNENICLDKDKKKYIKGGTPNGKEIIALPQKWLSKDRMDDDNKKGIKKSHSLSTVGTMTDPWKFHYIRGLKIDYIQKESKIHSFWDTKLEGSPVVTSAVFTVKTVPTNSDVELQGTVVDESGNEVKKLSLSKITTGKYELKWDGTDSSNDKIKPGKYKIQLRGTLDTLVKAVSDEIKVVRVGVTGIEFQDSYPLKLYDDISTFFSWKKVDFDIPAIQWKIKDLDDSDKPRKEPALSASEESSDTDNYSYPVCYKMGSKLKVKLTLGGKDYAAGDDIRVQLIDSTKFDSSDNEKIAAGGNTTFTAKAGNELPAKIFRTDNYKLDFHFAYKDASGAWHNMGAQKTKNHRVYT